MQNEKKKEIIFVLLGILAVGLLIHSIYKCYIKNVKFENQKNQIVENNVIEV